MSVSSTDTEHDRGFEFPCDAFSPSELVKGDNGKSKHKDIPLSDIRVARAFDGLILIDGRYDPNDEAWRSQLEKIIKRERKRYYKEGQVMIKKKLSEFLMRKYFNDDEDDDDKPSIQPYKNLLDEVKFRNGVNFKNGEGWSITDVATIGSFFSSFSTDRLQRISMKLKEKFKHKFHNARFIGDKKRAYNCNTNCTIPFLNRALHAVHRCVNYRYDGFQEGNKVAKKKEFVFTIHWLGMITIQCENDAVLEDDVDREDYNVERTGKLYYCCTLSIKLLIMTPLLNRYENVDSPEKTCE